MHGTLELESTYGKGTKAVLTMPMKRAVGAQSLETMSEEAAMESSLALSTAPFQRKNSDNLPSSAASYGRSQEKAKSSPKRSQKTDKAITGGFEQREEVLVLVVEDNLINQRIAVKSCERLGFHTAAANNGQEALDYLASGKRADVVLCDCQMPVLDGLEATRKLRTEEPFASMPLSDVVQTSTGGVRRTTSKARKLKDIPVIALTASAIPGDRERCIAAGMDDYLTKPLDTNAMEEKICKWAFRRQSVVDDDR